MTVYQLAEKIFGRLCLIDKEDLTTAERQILEIVRRVIDGEKVD